MNSTEILDLINFAAGDPSVNVKTETVRQGMQDVAFQGVMAAALDPYVTYGMKDVPGPANGGVGTKDFCQNTWDTLNALATRQLSGNAARAAVAFALAELNQPSQELLRRVILKDLRAGFGTTIVNKVQPGFIPEFPYMRCTLLSKIDTTKLPWPKGLLLQKKADGMFINLNVEMTTEGRLATIMSRQGTVFPQDALKDLVNDAKLYIKGNTQTHGELLVTRKGVVLPRKTGNGILNSVAQGEPLPDGHSVLFEAWDQIPLSVVKPKGKHAVPYKARFEDLKSQLPDPETGVVIRPIESITVFSFKEALAVYKQFLAQGFEGGVLKVPTGTWKDGTSKDQIKFKLEVTVDLKLTGFREGSGKNAATFGAAICQTSDGLLETGVAGFTDAMRKWIHEHRDELLANEAVFAVKANDIMKPEVGGEPYSLFLPRFVEVRKDKVKADTLQEVIDQFEAAINV